jgi:hypothetical protein
MPHIDVSLFVHKGLIGFAGSTDRFSHYGSNVFFLVHFASLHFGKSTVSTTYVKIYIKKKNYYELRIRRAIAMEGIERENNALVLDGAWPLFPFKVGRMLITFF